MYSFSFMINFVKRFSVLFTFANFLFNLSSFEKFEELIEDIFDLTKLCSIAELFRSKDSDISELNAKFFTMKWLRWNEIRDYSLDIIKNMLIEIKIERYEIFR